MTSKVDICNLALAKLSQDITIASMSERSKEARTFSRLWDPMRDLVLADREWPFAVKAVRLALDPEDPLPGWTYRYSRPNDCITALAVTDDRGMRNGRVLSQWCDPLFRGRHSIPYQQVHGSQGTGFVCDAPEAFLIYVSRVDDPGRFPAHFVDALACKLAEEAAPAIIGDRGFASKEGLKRLYLLALTVAAAHDFNESEDDPLPMSAAQAARD